jgi:hypothetical protein
LVDQLDKNGSASAACDAGMAGATYSRSACHWLEKLQLLHAVSCLEIHMREIMAAMVRCEEELWKEASFACKQRTRAANKQWKRMKHSNDSNDDGLSGEITLVLLDV